MTDPLFTHTHTHTHTHTPMHAHKHTHTHTHAREHKHTRTYEYSTVVVDKLHWFIDYTQDSRLAYHIGLACDTLTTNASDVCPDSVRPLLSTIVPETNTGTFL